METGNDAGHVPALTTQLADAIGTVIEGKRDVIDLTLAVLLSGGHLLLEDAPGVGKTMLARALAKTIDASVSRIQFTADLLPSDITGVSIFNPETRRFEFKPGGVFAGVVIADEINRSSPKTQSALLEAMEEHRVSVDGVSHDLPAPFFVVATQNPYEMQGTYPLPEAQRDRFTACLSMGYPEQASEIAMLDHHVADDPLELVTPVVDTAGLLVARDAVRRVFLHPALKEYLVKLLHATRADSRVVLGASPRSGLQWARMAQARAAMAGREYVIPEDVSVLAGPVLAHRVLLAGARNDRTTAEGIVTDIVARVPAPRRS